jgi:hypothetical protein
MIPKLVPGNDFTGALLYASRKGPLLMTNIVPAGGSYSPASLGQDMQLYATGRPDVMRPVLHIALRLPLQDAVRLVDADFLYLTRHFMKKMELYDTRYQYAVYKHDPDHVHLVISRIDISRKVWDDSFSYLRAMKVCRELEIEHNLTPVTSEFNMFSLRLTRVERAMEKRSGRPCPKRIIFDSVNEIILSCRSLDDMKTALSERDITMRVDISRGVSFGHNGFAFAGGRISRSCTLPCIRERLAANSSQDVVREWDNVIIMPRKVPDRHPGTDNVPQASARDSNTLGSHATSRRQSSGTRVEL